MKSRKTPEPVLVPGYVQDHVRWGYAHARELNIVLKKCCAGTELTARQWAMLAAIGGWQADKVQVTQRFILEALVQSGIAKIDKLMPYPGCVYSGLYMAGSSSGQLVVAHRESDPMHFTVTPQLIEIWINAGGAAR